MKRFANHLISTITPQLFRIAWLALVLTAPTTLALIAPTALGLSGVEAQTPITWTDVVGATYDHETHTLVRTASPNGWGTSGAASANRLSKNRDGYVEYTIDGELSTKAFGLSNGNSDSHYNTIDYSFHFVAENIYILEGSTVLGSFGTYSAGDVFKIERSGSDINYYHEGVLLLTSTTTANQTLLVDAAIKHENATLADMFTNFPDIYFDVATNEETNTFYSISGGGLSGTVATGSKTEYTIALPEDGVPTTITLNFIDGSSVDQGIDLVFDVDANVNLKNLRAVVSTGTYGLNDSDWSLTDMTDLTSISTSDGLNTRYTGTSYCDDQDWNYVHTTTYKSNTLPFSEGKVFADGLGRTVQTQARDYANDNTLVSQSIFDEFGRAAWQSLPAPKYTEDMCFKDYFVVNPNYSVYRWDDFDDKSATGNVDSPNGVGVFAKGSLGWYYDDQNYEEAFVPASDFPFATAEYWPDPLGRVKRTSAPGEYHKMGSSHENRLYQMNQAGELAWVYGALASHMAGGPPRAAARKSIRVDADGSVAIGYSDDAGRLIASCQSVGTDAACSTQFVKKAINTNKGQPGYVDIHLPDGQNGSLTLSLNPPQFWNLNDLSCKLDSMYKIMDLNTYKYLTEGADYSIHATTGAVTFLSSNYTSGHQFLRIFVEYPDCYTGQDIITNILKTSTSPSFFISQYVSYQLDYTQWTINYYDSKGRLKQTTPPAGIDCDFVPSLPTLDVYMDMTNTCSSCTTGSPYTYKLSAINEVADLTYAITAPVSGYDQRIDLRVTSGGLYIAKDPEICQFMASDGGANPTPAPTMAAPLSMNPRFTSDAVTPTHLPALQEGAQRLQDAIEQVATESGEVAAALWGGQNIGGPVPVGGDCPGSCDHCVIPDGYDVSASEPIYPAGKILSDAYEYCDLQNKEVDQISYIQPGGDWPSGYYCITCKTASEAKCSSKPYTFLAEFRLKVQFYGKNNSTQTTTLIPSNTEWINATLQYRLCDCDLRWDPTSYTSAYAQVLDAELDNYDEILLKWTDTEVARTSPGLFGAFQAGAFKDEFLSTLLLRIDYVHETYPIQSVNPVHTMGTTYQYDALNQLAKSTSPDAGTSGLTYNTKGQLRFSQDAAQAADDRYTYVVYDQAGRPIETGEYAPVGAGDIYFENQIKVPALAAGTTSVHSIADDQHGLTLANCSQQTYYQYDVPETTPAYSGTLSGYTSAFTLGQATKSYNDEHTSWYGYDRYGRQTWMVQHIGDLNKYVTLNYTYDFNHLLTEVAYQQEVPGEQFHHHFTYDENGRLKTVKTSTDGVASTGDLQARYEYYAHGPLKRVELGDETQGLDYVYTILGMLKAINHPRLDGTTDPGADGETATVNSTVAPDVFGIALDYFTGDYTRTGANISTTSGNVGNTTQDRYTGLVKAQRWQTNTGAISAQHSGNQLMYTYDYDNRYQLTTATFGKVEYASGVPQFTNSNTPLPDYRVENIAYDRNGNLTALHRKAYGTSLAMDEFAYNYASGTNQLDQLADAITSTWTMDLDNQAAGNYDYNAAGQLMEDEADVSWMTYDVAGLVTKVHSNSNRTILKASFDYNERGSRFRKTDYDGSGDPTQETYYVRDASGGLIAIYEKPTAGSLLLKEQPIYGAGRLGVYRDRVNVDETHYELNDHLGNVRAVIKRTKDLLGNAQLISFADYYPFGSEIPGRNGSLSGPEDYRHGYQGIERDPSTGWNSFELRQYDGRLGRWTSTDPYGQHHSPYLAMSNNPVSFIDPDGGYSYSGQEAPQDQVYYQRGDKWGWRSANGSINWQGHLTQDQFFDDIDENLRDIADNPDPGFDPFFGVFDDGPGIPNGDAGGDKKTKSVENNASEIDDDIFWQPLTKAVLIEYALESFSGKSREAIYSLAGARFEDAFHQFAKLNPGMLLGYHPSPKNSPVSYPDGYSTVRRLTTRNGMLFYPDNNFVEVKTKPVVTANTQIKGFIDQLALKGRSFLAYEKDEWPVSLTFVTLGDTYINKGVYSYANARLGTNNGISKVIHIIAYYKIRNGQLRLSFGEKGSTVTHFITNDVGLNLK